MTKSFARLLCCFVLAGTVLFTGGCGDSDGDKATTGVYTGTTVTLKGTLAVPSEVNADLLAATRIVPTTDSEVRTAFAKAAVLVNGAGVAAPVIMPSGSYTEWDVNLAGVRQANDGRYLVELTAGKVGLKGWVTTATADSFRIDTRTTAAALLAAESGMTAEGLLATYPTLVNRVASEIATVFTTDRTTLSGGVLTADAVKMSLASQASFLKEDDLVFDPGTLVTYLGRENDLDGNGVVDTIISLNTERTAVRFSTMASNSISVKSGLTALQDYTDAALLDDFAQGRTTVQSGFADENGRGVIIGLFLRRGSPHDTYAALRIRRIDLADNSFKGVVVEYRLVEGPSTALMAGTKLFARTGLEVPVDRVAATDFLTDRGQVTGEVLSYAVAGSGLGSSDSSRRLIRAIPGQPALANIRYAEPWNDRNYSFNMNDALKAVFEDRSPTIGDVFSVYFPATKHYALIKITALSANELAVAYRVNSAAGENRF
ncbi:MAG TPA: hypothetical protein PKM25_00335 [Candidatus Ozemobacteraceae bacterium]|nr:hypothetical protein [Candidatus Ozemobacteraceae bacterium]